MLSKEAMIRNLYRGEVLWLVYCCQSRALGKKITNPELQVRCHRCLGCFVYVQELSNIGADRSHSIYNRFSIQGIDWDGIDNEGRPLRRELLKTVVSSCEPTDMDPPGGLGPPGAAIPSGTAGVDVENAEDKAGGEAQCKGSILK